MLFEYRVYTCYPGKRDEFVKLMEEEVVPFQVSKGMVFVASFIDEQNPDKYIWMRRFENEEERVKLYDAVYQSDTWKNEMVGKVLACIDREKHQITRLVPTAKSILR